MILHIDMDAFYASVEQRDRPELRGRPVIVGGSSSGRGVVCAASYEARKFGVHSAMPAGQAKRLCPQGVFVRPEMEKYAVVSRQIRTIFNRYTPLVQPLSLDEAFLDVAGSGRLFGPPEDIGRRIKREISDETQLVASVGVAPNKFLAKIASDLDKPDGFCVVDPNAIQDFLDPLTVSRVWGVGEAAGKKLARLGVETVADLRQVPEDVLAARFGKWGRQLWRLARGIDARDVVPDRVAKSISHETTFRENIHDGETLIAWAAWLSEQVARRLRRHGMKARTVQIKLRDSSFHTITRAATLPEPSNVTRAISRAAHELVETAVARDVEQGTLSARLLGVGVHQFDTSGQSQGLLFEQEQTAREQRRDEAADAIADKFGKLAIRPGSALELPKKDRPNPYEGQ